MCENTGLASIRTQVKTPESPQKARCILEAVTPVPLWRNRRQEIAGSAEASSVANTVGKQQRTLPEGADI